MDQWFETDKVLNTNLNWQIGHIILANYLHGIASISGANEAIRKKINVQDYIKFYGPKSKPLDFEEEKPSAKELLENYELTFSLIEKGLTNIVDIDLENTTEVPNPAVQTKYQALAWLSQHQSWHNGQIAVLRRILSRKL